MIEFIVFSGAGVLGTIYAGAYQALMERDMLKNVKYWVGSSAGALAATLGACNVSADKLYDILLSTDFNHFIDEQSGLNKLVPMNMVSRLGTVTGKNITSWIENMLEQQGFNRNLTFSELYDLTGNHLCITTTSINTEEIIYLSRTSYPRFRIVDAIHASIIIPFLFQPVTFIDPIYCNVSNPLYDTYSPTCVDDLCNVCHNGCDALHKCEPKEYMFVDGGVLDNYPLHACDAYNINGQRIGINKRVLGFMPVSNGKWTSAYKSINSVFDYGNMLFETLHHKLHVERSKQDWFWERTIPIETYGMSSKNFNLTTDEKIQLYQSGYNATHKFFNVDTFDRSGDLFLPIVDTSMSLNNVPILCPTGYINNYTYY